MIFASSDESNFMKFVSVLLHIIECGSVSNIVYITFQKRLLELELSTGNTAEIIELANELLDWVNTTSIIPILNEKPPGKFEQLRQNRNDLQVYNYSEPTLYTISCHIMKDTGLPSLLISTTSYCKAGH